MNPRRLWHSFLVALLLSGGVQGQEAEVDYLREVKPLLQRCYACHGALRQQSSLRLDTADLMRRGGDSGPVLVAGQSQQSLLIHALTGGEGMSLMPPDGEGTRLTAREVELVRRWIDQGAKAPAEVPQKDPLEHWSFRPLLRPVLPDVDGGEATNPIDVFVTVQQQRLGLQSVALADRATLLRRVYLDLIGLPPSRDELLAFLADDSPLAYERVVDRLLDSPRYGERWGRHWMDVWRYSDWAGYRQEIREGQFHLWRWRDWIIESLNADKPYDEMIVEMLAGDEVAAGDPEVLRATGYLGRSWYKFNRNVWLDNVVEHAGKAFLGLTFNCARCHDHKYDPISQVDYYAMRAVFEAHEVRYDRLPGQSDVLKDGLARVFDKRISEPTYLFVRGNEQQPDKDHPVSPGLPAWLSVGLNPEPVDLPIASYYPALRPFVVEETLAQLRNDTAAADGALAQSRVELESSRARAARLLARRVPAALTPAEIAVEVARQATAAQMSAAKLAVRTAEARLAWTQADFDSYSRRLAAERAKYGIESQRSHSELAGEASLAERRAAAAKAEHDVLAAEQQLAAAQTTRPENDKSKKAIGDAQAKLTQAQATLDAARKKLAEPEPGNQYAPLGDVYPSTSTGRRLALARWIANRDNPLTARVAVNHMWLRHFARPLVPTVFDFGLNGQPPSFPELLDWLAVEFIESGWRMKPLHRRIVLSRTYQLASSVPPESAAIAGSNEQRDPDNQFLWRMNSRRAEAEVVRDSLLYVSGTLDLNMGGPEIDHGQGQKIPRRTVYFRHAKEKEMVFTKLFDGPGVAECYKREESIVPQQALALTNSPLSKSQARVLARRLAEDQAVNGEDLEDGFIRMAFEHVLTRRPTEAELALCRDFLSAQTKLLGEPGKLTAVAVGEAASIAPAAEAGQRARESLIHVLLNHHDFVTIR